MKPKAIFNWSGGKDSALALYKVLKEDNYDIISLLTTLSQPFNRISMHGVRASLLDKQADYISLPLKKLYLPENPDMAAYENFMKNALIELKEKGAQVSIFGDIFLEDLRQYREQKLAELDLKAIFPLWNKSTSQLMKEFLRLGFKTITTCVNEKYLDKSFVGRVIDEDFIKELPSNVDPCGENGEFHTFVFDGPLFKEPVPIQTGEIVYKKYSPPEKQENNDCFTSNNTPYEYGFWYCDLV